MSHYSPDGLDESPQPIAFLDDAHRNLALVRGFYGRDSNRYRHLLRRYRAVADELGCRWQLERRLHRLRRRPDARIQHSWSPHSRGGSIP